MGFYDEPQQEEVSYRDQNSQAPVPQQSPQYDRIIQEEKVTNFISQTSPSKNLEKIDKILKGFFYDHSKNEWIKVSHGIPEQIRMDYIQFLTPYLSEDVRMGRMDRSSINNIMAMVIEWSIDYLDIEADNYYWDEVKQNFSKVKNEETLPTFHYDIKYDKFIRTNQSESKKIYATLSEEQLSKIHYVVCSAVAFVLWRAENGVERDKMYSSLKLGDDFGAYAKQEEKKSLFSSILPWK